MKAIILAGGKGSRMGDLTKDTPKCMLSFGSYTPIERLIHQLNHCTEIVVIVSYLGNKIIDRINDNKVKFIEKTQFKTNANRYSLLLALEHLKESKEDICVFEADMVCEDELINYVTGTDFEERSTWFVSGEFISGMNGGAIRTDGKNRITGITYLRDKAIHISGNVYKMMGILRINKDSIKSFYSSLYWYCKKKGFLGYYLDALRGLPIYMGDASHYIHETYNTRDEYCNAKLVEFNPPTVTKKVEEIDVTELRPIEHHKPKRFNNIDCSEPIRIEKNHNLILDGHRRYHLLKESGVKKIKVIKFDYSEVDVWSLREEINITKESVIEKIQDGWIYPYKTVKHKFPKVVLE